MDNREKRPFRNKKSRIRAWRSWMEVVEETITREKDKEVECCSLLSNIVLKENIFDSWK